MLVLECGESERSEHGECDAGERNRDSASVLGIHVVLIICLYIVMQARK